MTHTTTKAAARRRFPRARAATVAGLLGHTSTSMLHRNYSHLTAQTRAMREALAAVRD